ncbi:MAG: hypothetical protein K8F91_16000, partial [Candidatus Obscuribacterales bacterium]|nr:hypothetical protein [Candidatus Obscuribacterales bacterium]
MNTKLRKSFALVMAQALIASCLPFTALAASENESYTNEISFDMPLNPKIEILAQENLSVLASTELTGQESGFQSGNIQPFNSKLEAGSSPLAEADDTLEARPGSLQSGSLQEDKVAQAVLEVNDVLGADTAEM